MKGEYVVYMLLCIDGSLYTGVTNNLVRRFGLHLAGKGARYTRSHPPIGVVYSEIYASRGEALVEEARMKRLSKIEKLALCSTTCIFDNIC
jgi:putative endonuclease